MDTDSMYQGIFNHEMINVFLEIFEERACAFLFQLYDMCFTSSSLDNNDHDDKTKERTYLNALNEISSWSDDVIEKELESVNTLCPDIENIYNFVVKQYALEYLKGSHHSIEEKSMVTNREQQILNLLQIPNLIQFIRAFYIILSKDNSIRKRTFFTFHSRDYKFVFMNAIRKSLWTILKEPLASIPKSIRSSASASASVPASASTPKTKNTVSSSIALKNSQLPHPNSAFKEYVQNNVAATSSLLKTKTPLQTPNKNNPPSLASVAKQSTPLFTQSSSSSSSIKLKTPHTVHTFKTPVSTKSIKQP
jgi:hypothetical protein